MTYCLMTEDGKVRVEIRCNLADKPEDVGDLVLGVREGRIMMIKPQKLPKKLDDPCDNTELDTDWTATGTNVRHINWPPIEDTK